MKPLSFSVAMCALPRGLICPLVGYMAPLSILGHVWVTMSCCDLHCLSQAHSPRGLWPSTAGLGGRKGCLARDLGSTTPLQAQFCDPCSRIWGAHPGEDSVAPFLPLPPRMLPRRETRSKWTSRVRARRLHARLHGPTAQTCTRTLKSQAPP